MATRRVSCAHCSGPTGPGVAFVVATWLDERRLLAAVEAGAGALLRRGEATRSRSRAPSRRRRRRRQGSGDLLARLLDQVGRLKRQALDPRGIALSGLSEREAAASSSLPRG